MPKPSHREKILSEGLKVIHQRGFANAGIREIVKAAGVPQGSFTNHFASKEIFGLAVVDLYHAGNLQALNETLLNDALPPLHRLRLWIERHRQCGDDTAKRNGCLFGNFAAEASDHSELIRQRLVEIFAEIQHAIATCLEAAIRAGEVDEKTDCEQIAGFTLAAFQGATLLAKARRSPIPVDQFKHILFTTVLSPPAAK